LLEWAKNNKPEIGRLIITGQGGGLTPVEIGKAEAMQVIEKPFKRLSQLIATVMGYFALNVRAPFVVVADESKHFRDMVIKAFKSSDVVAVPVKTIPSLYQVLQNHTPAAVLFDSIGSPDTLNDVCSLYGDKFPLIICTETSAAQRDEYLNAGASDVLQKPVSEAILLECVKKYLPASYREISV
jgi:DNA-binding NtrC family response regulator